MSYTLCPRCGQKALSIATQCPHCGDPFEIRHSYEATGSWPRIAPVAIAVVALGVMHFVVNALAGGPAAREGRVTPVAVVAHPAPAPRPKRYSPPPPRPQPAAADASVTPELPAVGAETDLPEPGAESPAGAAETDQPEPGAEGPAGAAETDPPEPGAERPADAEGTDPQERRYTTIWANVREARRPLAPVVAVLEPGEPVLVDSLSQEWYRVVADGRRVGYVYRELVDTAPPRTRY